MVEKTKTLYEFEAITAQNSKDDIEIKLKINNLTKMVDSALPNTH